MAPRAENRRRALIPLLEHWGKKGGTLPAGLPLVPVGKGKKALVFLAGNAAVRLFEDPLRFTRYLKVYSLLERAGVGVPQRHLCRATPELAGKGILAVSVEERVSPVEVPSVRVAEELGSNLARLHGIGRSRWGGLLLPAKGHYSTMLVNETLSRLRAWEERFGEIPDAETWLESWREPLSSLKGYQLIHGDVALGNTGLRRERVVLLDLVRSRYGFALEDVVAALDMLRRQQLTPSSPLVEAFWRGYSSLRPLSPDEEATLPFFEAAFHAKRLKRALKHLQKGEVEWHLRAGWHLQRLGEALKETRG